jgi:hypothetical protein
MALYQHISLKTRVKIMCLINQKHLLLHLVKMFPYDLNLKKSTPAIK